MKVSEKQELIKKLVARLEKEFGRVPESPNRTVLETLLYGICLENEHFETAERAMEALLSEFHDLNEIRVSSLSELVLAFSHQSESELRAHRLRAALQFVFEDCYEFDLEGIRKKTQDQAAKKLAQIPNLSAFNRHYVQQAALGAHLVPLDDRQRAVVAWLGLIEPTTSAESASEQLKPAVRKADAPAFCHLLRIFATQSPAARQFDPHRFTVPKEGYSSSDALARVDEALGGKKRSAAKTKPAKSAKAKSGKNTKPAKSAKTSRKKSAAKASPAKTAGKKKEAVKKSSGTKQSAARKKRGRAATSK